jgi:hypothetical protein
MDLCKATSIVSEDVIQTLQWLGMLKNDNGNYVLLADSERIDAELTKFHKKRKAVVDPTKLHWTPVVDRESIGKKDKFALHAKKKLVDAEVAEDGASSMQLGR